MNPPSWDCSCRYVSFSISDLQPGYRPRPSYDRRSSHSLDNQLKTLYMEEMKLNKTICISGRRLAKLTSLGIQFRSSNCRNKGLTLS